MVQANWTLSITLWTLGIGAFLSSTLLGSLGSFH